jgi:hypothetical protein
MKLDVLRGYINYISRKDPIGNTLNIEELNKLLPVVAFEYLRKITGLPDNFRKGDNVLNYGIGIDQIMNDKTRYLMVSDALDIDGNGIDTLPIDYFFLRDILHEPVTDLFKKVTILNRKQFNARKSSFINIPNSSNPVCTIEGSNIEFLPDDLGDGVSTTLYYIKYPSSPHYGYAIDYATAEEVYIENGACFWVTSEGSIGNIITATGFTGAQPITFGTYTVRSGDNAESVMIGIARDVNNRYLNTSIKAIYDGERVWLKDELGSRTTLGITVTGGIVYGKQDFSQRSIQFDWQNDLDAMNEIAELLLEKIGISIRDSSLSQYAEIKKEQ